MWNHNWAFTIVEFLLESFLVGRFLLVVQFRVRAGSKRLVQGLVAAKGTCEKMTRTEFGISMKCANTDLVKRWLVCKGGSEEINTKSNVLQ